MLLFHEQAHNIEIKESEKIAKNIIHVNTSLYEVLQSNMQIK